MHGWKFSVLLRNSVFSAYTEVTFPDQRCFVVYVAAFSSILSKKIMDVSESYIDSFVSFNSEFSYIGMMWNNAHLPSVLPRQRFRDILAKKSKCRIQNCLGAPFVVYEFVWGRILNKYAVISPDKQNKDRKVSDCVSLTRCVFVLLTTLKQCINLKWPLNFLNHVSHSHLLMSSRIKRYWFFLFFVNGDHHIFATKKHTWSERLRLHLKVFDITITMDILLIYNC